MAASIQEDQWLHPVQEDQGLTRYVHTLRERWWLVLACLLVTTTIAVVYVQAADKVYKAGTEILVTPVSNNDATLTGLGLILSSNDPTRDVSTAATLIATPTVAQRVIDRLRLDTTPQKLLNRVKAEPLAQSSVVTVSAEDSTPESAADLANAFASEAVDLRTESLREQLDRTIPVLREQLDAVPPTERATLAARIATLVALRGVPDPTLRVVTAATPPETQTSPRPRLALAAGIFGGLVLGIAAAFGLQALDPRVRREDQLRALFRLPILARIPRETNTRGKGALSPNGLHRATTEAYRTLRTTLAASRGTEFRSRSVLVTGSLPSEGKSTTAINFAFSLVQAGHRVILIEADMRRPTVGAALGIRPEFGIASVLVGEVDLETALVHSPEYGPDLRMLLVDRPQPELADRLSLPTARQLIADAEAIADFVVIDSPPLTEIIDALPLAQEATDVLVVVRLGRSRSGKLVQLGELLAQHGIKPAGIALVGVERPTREGYYYQAEPSTRDRAPA